MEITEVRVKLMDDPHDRLRAFCSITFDGCFVVRDLKIIQGTKGSFVAMPSRKLTDRCPQCQSKNHLRAQYCTQCGVRLREDRADTDDVGRAKLYADIAHPINSRCREMIQSRVLQEYEQELVRSTEPGYVCRYDDYGEDDYEGDYEPSHERSRIVSGNDDQTHRIEPAASSPGPPHHDGSRENAAAAASNGRAGNADDEPFGAGLL